MTKEYISFKANPLYHLSRLKLTDSFSMLEMLANFLKLLNSDASPSQISLGLAFSLFLGLTPLLSFHNLILIFIVLIVRVNLTSFFLGLTLFSLIAMGLNTVSISLGEQLLTAPSLQGIWTGLYQSDFWRVTQFNQTLVLGGFSLSLLLFIPTFLTSLVLIRLYRKRFMAWIKTLKISRMLKASRFYQAYEKLGVLND
jgi:uncharacterized protein (TIGR03546 family)